MLHRRIHRLTFLWLVTIHDDVSRQGASYFRAVLKHIWGSVGAGQKPLRLCAEGGPVLHPQLLGQPRDMRLYCADRKIETLRDLAVREAVDDEPQNVKFATGDAQF